MNWQWIKFIIKLHLNFFASINTKLTFLGFKNFRNIKSQVQDLFVLTGSLKAILKTRFWKYVITSGNAYLCPFFCPKYIIYEWARHHHCKISGREKKFFPPCSEARQMHFWQRFSSRTSYSLLQSLTYSLSQWGEINYQGAFIVTYHIVVSSNKCY